MDRGAPFVHFARRTSRSGGEKSLKWEFTRNATRLAECIKGPFLMGETMTIADIIAAHCLNWAYNAKFEITDQRLLDYAKSMRGRDAFKRAVAR